MVTTLVELAATTTDRVPFTRPYVAGDAGLRKRWPLYFLGMFAFAYWPARIEMRCFGGREPWLIAAVVVAALMCHLVGRYRAVRWSVASTEDTEINRTDFTVLDIGAVTRPIGV
jgi:hypothetical protein